MSDIRGRPLFGASFQRPAGQAQGQELPPAVAEIMVISTVAVMLFFYVVTPQPHLHQQPKPQNQAL